ncbi:CheR family methyltransferase [Algiphilus aromaticivorans]|uniref:CheR family methyltransferase n=1 Tax=Algiphilus aromaticivorans TaxID=382454 RepID=UPI0005C2075D|nr:CheR family methyltransferase [Algiphilus aromaticivorans]
MAPEQEQAPAAEDIEVELFIEALRRAWGYDFSGYLRASLKRRILALVAKRDLSGISALIAQCLREPDTAADIVAALSVPHSSLFRDPDVFARLRTEVLPWLASHPSPTIWHAGCAAGEEAYSLAILLHEAGLLARSRIYATDINEAVLARAREGIFPLAQGRDFAEGYLAAGGAASFADYMLAQYGRIKLHDWLRAPMTFAVHNLATDEVFVEAQMVICRNVFIYFDSALRARAVRVFAESLVRGGYLLLGAREHVDAALMRRWFQPLGEGLYRRLAEDAE